MNQRKLDYALRQALNNLDRWNDATGIFVKHTTYYFEYQKLIEDAVKIGIMAAYDIPIEFDKDGALIDKRNIKENEKQAKKKKNKR